MKIAVYPGSFDPITAGHLDIIRRINKVFDQSIVLVAKSPQKTGLFSELERKLMIEEALEDLRNVTVDIYEGLTVDYVRQQKAHVIVRGLRAVTDFDYEMSMSSMNQKIAPDIETMLVFARPEFYYVSSRAVKEVAMHGGDVSELVPNHVCEQLKKRIKEIK